MLKCPYCEMEPYPNYTGLKSHLRFCSADRPQIKTIDGIRCKFCNKCGKYKPFDDFTWSNRTHSGLEPTCRACKTKNSNESKKRHGPQFGGDAPDPLQVVFSPTRKPNWEVLEQELYEFLEAGYDLVKTRPPNLNKEVVVVSQTNGISLEEYYLPGRLVILSHYYLSGTCHTQPMIWACNREAHKQCSTNDAVSSVIFSQPHQAYTAEIHKRSAVVETARP